MVGAGPGQVVVTGYLFRGHDRPKRLTLSIAEWIESKGKTPLPRELQLAFDVERWKALPKGGGLLDQPAGLLRKMTWAANVHRTLLAYQAQPLAHRVEWLKQNSTEAKIYGAVKEAERIAHETTKPVVE